MQIKSYGSGAQYKKKSKNANSKKLTILLAVLGTLVAGFVVVAILIGLEVTSDDYSSIMDEPQAVAANNVIDNNIISADATQTPDNSIITYNGKRYEKNDAIVNLLFLGIDSDAYREHERMGYRSDMMMVCAVNTVNKTATLISIPRDTYTNVYKIDKNGKIEKTVMDKLNAAYAYGGGPNSYSAQNSKACVQMFLQRECELENDLDFTLNIPVNFYASIDLEGIIPLTKAVGGVKVKLEESIPNVGNKGETVTLKYENADLYLRNRHDSSAADFSRTARQRTFMIALAKKIKDMGAVDAVTSLYDELQEYVKTDLNLDQMLDFAKILNGVDIDAIQMLSIPGEGGNTSDGTCVVFHDEQATLEMLLSVYYTEVQ